MFVNFINVTQTEASVINTITVIISQILSSDMVTLQTIGSWFNANCLDKLLLMKVNGKGAYLMCDLSIDFPILATSVPVSLDDDDDGDESPILVPAIALRNKPVVKVCQQASFHLFESEEELIEYLEMLKRCWPEITRAQRVCDDMRMERAKKTAKAMEQCPKTERFRNFNISD